MTKTLWLILLLIAPTAQAQATDVCANLHKARRSIRLDVDEDKQVAALSKAYDALNAADKSLNSKSSDSCVDAFLLLTERLIRADSSPSAFETLGSHRTRNKDAIDRGLKRLPAEARKLLDEKLKIYEAAEKDAAAGLENPPAKK